MYHELGILDEEIIFDTEMEYRVGMDRENFEIFSKLVGKISKFQQVFDTL